MGYDLNFSVKLLILTCYEAHGSSGPDIKFPKRQPIYRISSTKQENPKGNLSICMHGPEQSSKDKHTVHLRGSLFWTNNCQIQLTEYEP
jgi:hypothetical protein